MSNWFTPEIISLLGRGLGLTIVLTLLTSLLATAMGIVIGSLRLVGQRRATWPATLFVETFRNIPALILIIFWAFAFPNAFPAEIRSDVFFNNPVMNSLTRWTGLAVPWYAIAAGLGLTLNTAAYIAELFRAGVRTMPRQHVEAATTMGASTLTVFRVILVPHGLRVAYPAITSRLIHNLKNTALASLVAVPEFFNGVQTAITRSFLAIEFLVVAAIVYLLLAFAFSSLLRGVERLLQPRPTPYEVTAS